MIIMGYLWRICVTEDDYTNTVLFLVVYIRFGDVGGVRMCVWVCVCECTSLSADFSVYLSILH